MGDTLHYPHDTESDEGKNFIASLESRLSDFDHSVASLESVESQLTELTQLSVSNEGFSDSVRAVLQTVLQFLKRMWERMADLAADLVRSTAFLKARMLYARSYLNEIEGLHAKQGKLDVSKVIELVSTDRAPARDARMLLENLNTLERQLATVRRQYLPMVQSIGANYVSMFAKWGELKPEEWLAELNRIASGYQPMNALSSAEAFTNFGNTNFRAGAKMSRPLPGRKSVVAVEVPLSELGTITSEIERAARYRSAQAVLAELRSDDKDAEGTEMAVLSQRQLDAVLTGVERLIKEVDTTSKDDTRRSIREMGRVLDRLSSANMTVGQGEIEVFQTGLAYARVVARWCREPYFALLSHTTMVSNSMIRLCNLHVKAYTEEPKSKSA